jgi:hypothetical protein
MIGWQVNYDEQTKININSLCGIRTNGLSAQAIKAYASDHAATGTDFLLFYTYLYIYIYIYIYSIYSKINLLNFWVLVKCVPMTQHFVI